MVHEVLIVSMFGCSLEFVAAIFVSIELRLLCEIDAEEGRQQRIGQREA